MIRLVTNREPFANDLGEELRLFLGDVAIVVNEPAPDAALTVSVLLSQDGGALLAVASSGECTERYECRLPGASPLIVKRYEKRAVKIALFRLLHALYPAVSTPWGSLTGIRPTKLFRELSAAVGEDDAAKTFRGVFDVSLEKTALASSITRVQSPFFASVRPEDVDVYIGIPYCRSRCLYCSFGSLLARDGDALEQYLRILERDISAGAELVRATHRRIRCAYFGGGTPTVLSSSQLDRLLTALSDAYGALGAEYTVEAGRPDTITREKLEVLRAHGVGRISINPQSMQDATLARMGRTHTAREITEAFSLARDVGFDSINMDLIVGLPGEGLADVQDTLRRVLALSPENLTVHTLAIKRSSRLREHLDEYPMPDAAAAESMVREAFAAATGEGYRPYYMYRQKYMQGNLENVGYAKPGHECMYNIDMMEETVSILAHGAGAMTKRVFGSENRIERIPNPKHVPTYAAKLPQLFAAKERLFSD